MRVILHVEGAFELPEISAYFSATFEPRNSSLQPDYLRHSLFCQGPAWVTSGLQNQMV